MFKRLVIIPLSIIACVCVLFPTIYWVMNDTMTVMQILKKFWYLYVVSCIAAYLRFSLEER